jgi:hypothetical protein
VAADEVLTVLGAGAENLALVHILAGVVPGQLEAWPTVAEEPVGRINAQLVATSVVFLALVCLQAAHLFWFVLPVATIIAKVAHTFLRQAWLSMTAVKLRVRVALASSQHHVVRAVDFVRAIQALHATGTLEMRRDAVAVGALELLLGTADDGATSLLRLIAAIRAVSVAVAHPFLVDAVALVLANKGVLPTVRGAVYCLFATLLIRSIVTVHLPVAAPSGRDAHSGIACELVDGVTCPSVTVRLVAAVTAVPLPVALPTDLNAV